MEAPSIGECEPISRPRLYKIAHSARFLQSGPLANSTGHWALTREGADPPYPIRLLRADHDVGGPLES